MIDPAIRSAIDQGFPIILYDYKYAEQSSRIAGVADVDMARQVAIVLNRNFKSGGKGSEDPFFTNSGDQLIQAVLLLAKTTPYPDIIFCAKALGANNLPARV